MRTYSLNQKLPHHPHILMFQVMTMEHEQALVILEWLDDTYRLTRHNEYGIFKAAIDKALVDRRIIAFASGIDTAADNLE